MLLPQAHLHVHGAPEPPAAGLRFEVQTTAPNETFTLPAFDTGVYNATIDWGDGQQSTITAYNDPDLVHVYANAGTHEITVSGPFPQVYFSGLGDRNKVLRILDLGGEQTSLRNSWRGCNNLTEVRGQIPAVVTEVRDAFRMSGVVVTDANMLHLASLPRTDNMFMQSDIVTLDAAFFQGQTIMNRMSEMFRDSEFTTIPAGLFDDLTGMIIANSVFLGAKINAIPAGLFDNMSAVSQLQQCFQNNTNLTSLPAGLLDNQINLTNISFMFAGTGLTSLPSELLAYIKATSVTSIFRDSQLLSIPVDLFGAKTDAANASSLFRNNSIVEVPSGFFDSLINADCDYILYDNDLTTVYPGEFDSMTRGDFDQAFANNALTEGSVDNILVSLDASNVSNGTVHVNGGTNAAPGAAGQAAVTNLTGKGWTVVTN